MIKKFEEDESPVLPYLLYVEAVYYPSGDNGDLQCSADTLEELKEELAKVEINKYIWWTILDHKTMCVVESGGM